MIGQIAAAQLRAFARYLISPFPRRRETDAGRRLLKRPASAPISTGPCGSRTSTGAQGKRTRSLGCWPLSLLRQRALGNLTQVPCAGLLLYVNSNFVGSPELFPRPGLSSLELRFVGCRGVEGDSSSPGRRCRYAPQSGLVRPFPDIWPGATQPPGFLGWSSPLLPDFVQDYGRLSGPVSQPWSQLLRQVQIGTASTTFGPAYVEMTRVSSKPASLNSVLYSAAVRSRAPSITSMCPAGERLAYHYTNEENGLVLRRYWTTACQSCAIKHSCTPSKERRITRWGA